MTIFKIEKHILFKKKIHEFWLCRLAGTYGQCLRLEAGGYYAYDQKYIIQISAMIYHKASRLMLVIYNRAYSVFLPDTRSL